MSVYTKILLEARKKIESKENNMICFAIGFGQPHPVERIRLTDWIHDFLGDSSGYAGWMRHNHAEILEQMTVDDFRVGRLQWLDWMIANVDEELSK